MGPNGAELDLDGSGRNGAEGDGHFLSIRGCPKKQSFLSRPHECLFADLANKKKTASGQGSGRADFERDSGHVTGLQIQPSPTGGQAVVESAESSRLT